jgi:hypothetical protein
MHETCISVNWNPLTTLRRRYGSAGCAQPRGTPSTSQPSLPAAAKVARDAHTTGSNSAKRTVSTKVSDLEISIPLEITAVVSYFDSRLPREHEIESLPHIHLTAPADWQKYSTTIAGLEPQIPIISRPRMDHITTNIKRRISLLSSSII